MLENRSFDCMMGYLYSKSEAFDGLDGSERNPWHRLDGSVEDVRVWNSPAILYGEQLIASVYNAVRSAPIWRRTLLIVVYDEHGGCFDHVPPPPAVPPGGPCPAGFEFDRYGVRVPAVLISPYVAPGSIIRPPQNPAGEPTFPFDHASIIATLQKLFELGPPMTPRVVAAPDLLCALTLGQPENDGPEHVATHPRQPSRREAWAHARRPRNRLQRSMRNPLWALPGTAARGIAHLKRLRPRRRR